MPEMLPSAKKETARLTEQTCRTCGVLQTISEFWKQKCNKNGYFSECKACVRARQRRFYQRNAAKRIASSMKLRLRNPVAHILTSAKARARKMGYEFDLTKQDIVIPERCPVLGIKLVTRINKVKGHQFKDSSPSIDRVDNSRGYTADNIVIVSFRANRLKSNASISELRRMADFYEKRSRANAKAAERGRVPAADLFGKSDVSVPSVQPHQKKQKSRVHVSASG